VSCTSRNSLTVCENLPGRNSVGLAICATCLRNACASGCCAISLSPVSTRSSCIHLERNDYNLITESRHMFVFAESTDNKWDFCEI